MKLKFSLWSLLTLFAISMATVGCSDDDQVVTPDTPAARLSFALSIDNVQAHGADMKVVPSADDQTYYAAYLPTEDIQGKEDQAVIAEVMASVKDTDLYMGTQLFKGSEMNLKAQTNYTFFAFGYAAGKATTNLTKSKFMTLKEDEKPQPENPDQQDNKGEVVELTAETFAQWIYDYKTDAKKENFLSDIPAVIDFYGPGCGEHLIPIFDKLAAEFNGKINFFRFNFTTSDNKEVRDYMGVTMCPTLGFFKKGQAPAIVDGDYANSITEAQMRAEIEDNFGIKSEGNENPDPQPGNKAPEVTLFGVFNDKTAAIDFSMTCVSKNAEKAGYMALPTEVVEKELKKGKTLDELVNYYGGYAPLEGQDLEMINGEGLTISMDSSVGITAGMQASFILKVENANGNVVKRADAQLENDVPNAGPDIVLTGHGNSSSIWFVAKASTRDAIKGGMGVFPKSKIDDVLSAGGSLSQIVEGNEDNRKMFTPFDQVALDMINMKDDDKGLKLQIGQAQIGMVYSAVMFVYNQNGRTIKRANAQINDQKADVLDMSESMFLDNVWNYELDAEFKYRGDRAISIDLYATWCGNCKKMEPIYNKMAEEFKGKVTAYKLDVESTGYVHQMLAKQLGVNGGIPLFVFISETGEISYIQGTASEAKMRQKFASIAGQAKNPDVTLRGEYLASEGLAQFFVQCTSQDAVSASWVIADTYAIDDFIKQNNMTVDEFIEANADNFPAEYVQAINGPGLNNKVAVKAGYSVTTLLAVLNYGGRTVKRADVAAPGKSSTRSMEEVAFKTLRRPAMSFGAQQPVFVVCNF